MQFLLSKIQELKIRSLYSPVPNYMGSGCNSRDGLVKSVQIHREGGSFLGSNHIKIKHKKVKCVEKFSRIWDCNVAVELGFRISEFL